MNLKKIINLISKTSLVPKVLAFTLLASVGIVSTAHAEIPAGSSVAARIEAENYNTQQGSTSIKGSDLKIRFTNPTYDGVTSAKASNNDTTTTKNNWVEYDNIDLTGVTGINFVNSNKFIATPISVYASDTAVTGTPGGSVPSEAILLGKYTIPVSSASGAFISGVMNFQQSVSGTKNIYLVYPNINNGYMDYFELLKAGSASTTAAQTTSAPVATPAPAATPVAKPATPAPAATPAAKPAQTTSAPAASAAKTGWVKLADSTWNYYEKTGAKAASKWVNDGGTWYYLKADGAMATGWFKDSDGKWYFLKASGAMAVNEATPDGYYVNASGVWVK
jgi:hypothetical protein